MAAYTYLLQVQPKSGRNWANLLEPRTGAPIEGTLGIVDVPDDGLPSAARKVMEPFLSMGLKIRISFWAGRRLNEKLYPSEVVCAVYDDGTVVNTDIFRQDTSGEPAQPATLVRPECPHGPHDGACGHEGDCRFAHNGTDCQAVRAVCPACAEEGRPAAVREIVSRIPRDGKLVLRCSSCERLSFQFDAELVCDTCHWLVPDVNEELADRFADNGGAYPPEPGSCAGCSQQLSPASGPFSFNCLRCGRSVTLWLDSFEPGQTVTTICPSKECGEFITIPPSIWCRECGQNLRPMNVIRKLVLAANDIQLPEPSNPRDDESTRLARRLAVAAESSTRRYSSLTDEQKRLVLDRRYLDSMAFSTETPPDWIRDIVEIRAAGHEVNRKGGMRAMQELHLRVMELGSEYRSAARHIELYWDRIGDWRN